MKKFIQWLFGLFLTKKQKEHKEFLRQLDILSKENVIRLEKIKEANKKYHQRFSGKRRYTPVTSNK